MFCPNCAAPNEKDQHFCRTCGLKLDAIAAELAEQRPSAEFAELLKKKQRFEMMGVASLSLFGLLFFMIVIVKVYEAKAFLFGPGVILWSGVAAMMIFGLLSVFFFNYPKVFMNIDKVNPRLSSTPTNDSEAETTRKLIEDRPFEPVPSVTEDSTDLLYVDARTSKLE